MAISIYGTKLSQDDAAEIESLGIVAMILASILPLPFIFVLSKHRFVLPGPHVCGTHLPILRDACKAFLHASVYKNLRREMGNRFSGKQAGTAKAGFLDIPIQRLGLQFALS